MEGLRREYEVTYYFGIDGLQDVCVGVGVDYF